jgi:serine phosphatase RsbU (regulator of sigma subunit)
VKPQRQYVQRLAEINAKVAAAQLAPEVLVGQAAGLLAGRVGCRVDEAQAHLLQLAAEQGREPQHLAVELMATVEGGSAVGTRRLRSAMDHVFTARRSDPPRGPQADTLPSPTAGWTALVQQVLDAMPGHHTVLMPVRDHTGTVTDFTVAAASPAVHAELTVRGHPHVVGEQVSAVSPEMPRSPVWHAWLDVLGDGQPRELGPTQYPGRSAHDPAQLIVSSQVHPVGPGVMTTWTIHNEHVRLTDRITQTERLGNLGWGEANLVTGEVTWSDQMYRIYDRDPARGPMSGAESQALTLPQDAAVHQQAVELFARGETVDVTYRIRLHGEVKHLRTVLDADRDVNGRPVRVYGITQDITARETSRAKLAEFEQQLREQRETLAAEHRLATQLQQIILPVPDGPIDLPGLRVAVRYLPAEQASRVGGDWYHAAPADDDSLILAIGDVAGHGIHAAATMAQLRHILAALTLTTTSDPAELLAHLNRLLHADRTSFDTATATAAIARYEPDTGTLRWAQAGHPAPLRTRRGVTTALPRPDGPMLGAVRDARYTCAGTTLHPGDLLLLYTDGLIEHRDHTLDEGLAPIISTLDRVAVGDSCQPLADLLGQLHQANPDDDTCILAARPLPNPDPHERRRPRDT